MKKIFHFQSLLDFQIWTLDDGFITLFSSRSNCFVIFVLLSFLTQAFGNISVSKTFLFFLIYIKIIFNLINYGQRMWSV